MSASFGESTAAELAIRAKTASLEEAPGAMRPAAESADEDRPRVMRIAEYTPFPRISRDQQKRRGFTTDATGPILRIAARDREKPGILLRVVVRGIDGRPQLDTLARVAWCREHDNGHVSLGLAVADGDHRRARLVRHLLEECRGASEA
jgi:hypothetical protein